MQPTTYRLLFVILLSVSFLTACQKTIDTPNGNPITDPGISAADKLKDSVLLYARDIYLWYNQIPASFNARSYADPNKIMEAIRQYSIEPGINGPADRFSFAMKQAEWNQVSSGISGDFGISVFFFNSTDLRVKYVERESPAGKAGIKRGWRITKINGSTNINSADQNSLNNVVTAVFNSSSTSFTFLKPDGTSVDITLNATSYKTHPVMADSVYSISGKNIGYMVFHSFLGDTTEIYSEFSRVFNRFAAAGVNDVIIDLRYNGGGYVSVATKLSNYLAPSSATGLMMQQKYNDKYSQYNSSTNFNKTGPLNIPRVFFIVSSSSASASEMVINNLIPVMDVKLVGRNNTYGKPVGFFPIPVGDWYIFPVSFKTVNKNGESNYYNGFTPQSIVADGVDKNWGDVTEASLASAIKYITTGGFSAQFDRTYQELPQVTNSNFELDKHAFKGTISTGKNLKLK